MWNSFDWSKYESCNKCGLACYLEPSLFSWSNMGMVRDRIVSNAFGHIGRRRQRVAAAAASAPA